MGRRTKIICTIGPSVESYEKMLQLTKAGMNVARLNFSHGDHERHAQVIENLKKVRDKLRIPLSIMLDTKGPEVRIGHLDNDIPIEEGQRLQLGKQIPIVPEIALEVLNEGDSLLIDDGYIMTKVVEKSAKGIWIEGKNSGVIKSQKGVNIPHADIPLPAMTEQDIADITFGVEQDVDFIAASFIRCADHVKEIKELLKKLGGEAIQVIAKIENAQGVENFDSIVQVADGIMIARGDLGVELPIERVPVLQKEMIRKSVEASKPVVTATQMLESMIGNPRPTRAEASDVANAIYDSTSCVMLSGETAVGKYPIETLQLMCSIVEEAEKQFPYQEFIYQNMREDSHDVSSAISQASVKTAYNLGAKAIFAFTKSGSTARLISRFRPEMPIVALTDTEKTYHQLALSWGVMPAPPSKAQNSREALYILTSYSHKNGLIQYGDLVIITAGSPFGVSGTTNMMMVESLGEVLVRGHEGTGKEVEGEIEIVLTPDDVPPGKILVISQYTPAYEKLFERAKAIILQNHPEDLESEQEAMKAAEEKGIPILIRADGAMKKLSNGQKVILDPTKGIVSSE